MKNLEQAWEKDDDADDDNNDVPSDEQIHATPNNLKHT